MKKVSDDLTKLRERMTEVRKEAGNDYETYGCVWLFVREPATKKAAE